MDQLAPLVSVVLPTYNGSRYIATSIESCLGQTHGNLELIVVDGGSTDGTPEIVTSFSDPRIKLVHQVSNTGRLPGALNLGFANATGDYLTWTQDDDIYTSDAIEVMLAYLQRNPEVGMVYTGFSWIDEHGNVIKESNTGPPEALSKYNSVGHCFLYRRSVAQRIGEYDVDYYMSEDCQYWMRVYKQFRMAQLPGRHYQHRWHSDSLTVKGYGRYWALRVAAKARREVLRINWLEYQRQVAASFIEEGFAAYMNGDVEHVNACFAKGIVRNPTWLANRGVVAISVRSLLALRSR